MGWEWHNRERDRCGQFAGGREMLNCQVHIRCTKAQRESIRARAFAQQKDITEYLLDLVDRDIHRRAVTYGTRRSARG